MLCIFLLQSRLEIITVLGDTMLQILGALSWGNLALGCKNWIYCKVLLHSVSRQLSAAKEVNAARLARLCKHRFEWGACSYKCSADASFDQSLNSYVSPARVTSPIYPTRTNTRGKCPPASQPNSLLLSRESLKPLSHRHFSAL